MNKAVAIEKKDKQKINPVARNEMVVEYAPLIKMIAHRLAMRLPPHIQLDDLITAGVLGLMDAIEKYDPTRDIKFKTYAEFRIRGAMLDELRAMDWAPRSMRQKAHSVQKSYTNLRKKLGREATNEEVAEDLGINLEEYHKWIDSMNGLYLLSYEDIKGANGDFSREHLLKSFATNNSENPLDLLEISHLREQLGKFIDELPNKEKLVISLYYVEELTMKEIGHTLGISESRVSQIHTKAILRLRSKMTEMA